jgi:hypothetical protein
MINPQPKAKTISQTIGPMKSAFHDQGGCKSWQSVISVCQGPTFRRDSGGVVRMCTDTPDGLFNRARNSVTQTFRNGTREE